MTSPSFVNVPGVTRWTYRGQITPVDETMDIEVHIKKIETNGQQVTLLADASLWKNKIRIYEVTDAAIALVDA